MADVKKGWGVLFKSVPDATPWKRKASIKQSQVFVVCRNGKQVRPWIFLHRCLQEQIHHMVMRHWGVFGEFQEVYSNKNDLYLVRINLAQREAWPLPSLLGNNLQVLGMSASSECLCLPGCLSHARQSMLRIWFMVKALGNTVSHYLWWGWTLRSAMWKVNPVCVTELQ